jgi:hypothetical protein
MIQYYEEKNDYLLIKKEQKITVITCQVKHMIFFVNLKKKKKKVYDLFPSIYLKIPLVK